MKYNQINLNTSLVRWFLQCERASGLAECPLGLWMSKKSNLDRKRDQCACRRFRFWDSQKYMRFQWSFKISIVCLVPSRMCLHSSRPQMTDNSSLSWIS